MAQAVEPGVGQPGTPQVWLEVGDRELILEVLKGECEVRVGRI